MATLVSTEMRWLANELVNNCGYSSAVLSGIAPDQDHLNGGGFHVSVNDLRAYGNQNDYSNTHPDDRNLNPEYGAGIDISLAKTDMIRLYGRIKTVWADPTDPRRKYFAAVNCWDGTGDATRFDFTASTPQWASPDHTWHECLAVHRRWVRDMAAMRAIASAHRGETKAQYNPTEDTVSQADVIAALKSAEGKKLVGDAVWASAFGTDSTERRFGRREAPASTYLMLSAIYGFDLVAGAAAEQAFRQQVVKALTEIAADPGNTVQRTDQQAGVIGEQLAAKLPKLNPADIAKAVADEEARRMQS